MNILKNFFGQAPELAQLPAPEFKSIDAELANLRAPEEKEAERRARIAGLEEDKTRQLAEHAEAQRQADIQGYLPTYIEAATSWAEVIANLEFELKALFKVYQSALPAYQMAGKLAVRLKALGYSVDELPVRNPRTVPTRADHWLQNLHSLGRATELFREALQELEESGGLQP